MNLFITKPVSSGEPTLRRVLTARQLVLPGLGGILRSGN
jgi:hypothetical protein